MKKLLPRKWAQFVPSNSIGKELKIGISALALMFGGLSTANAQGYDVTLAQQCNNSNPGTIETLVFSGNLGVPNGDATLTITSLGDIGLSTTSTERLDYYDENNSLIGTTGSNGNCNNDVFTYTMPQADVVAFAADNMIEIEVRPASGVNTNQCSGQIGSAAYCSTGRLQFPQVTGPNDCGVASIDSPNVFCSGIQNVVATIQNYGTNQVSSVMVNWSFNGVTQTPISYTQTLDTFNGVGLNSAQIVLGQKNFNAGVTD